MGPQRADEQPIGSPWLERMVTAPPLIRARHVRAFARAAKALGRPAEGLLDGAAIPSECLSSGQALVPVVYFRKYLTLLHGGDDLAAASYRAAAAGLADHDSMLGQLSRAGSLGEALGSGGLGAAEMTSLSFRFGRWERRTWLYVHPDRLVPSQPAWYLYFLRPMIDMVRLAGDRQWWPRRIALPCRRSARIDALDFASRSKLEANTHVLAIEVPRRLLDAPLTVADEAPSFSPERDGIPADFLLALQALLASYIGKRALRITDIADICGASVRSVQRRIREYGCSYSELLRHATVSAAIELLCDANRSITDIAYDFGYSDPAHFSRAFQRSVGVSPRVFRLASLGGAATSRELLPA
jgi:AraC-like DNA-binding protein